MAIGCKDFTPALTRQSFFSQEHESFEALMARVNTWIATAGIEVINIETVVLPNLDPEKTPEAVLRTSGELASFWYQMIRVWYDVPSAQ